MGQMTTKIPKPRTSPLQYGRWSYGRTAEAMVAASLRQAAWCRKGRNFELARVWIADAQAWRTGRFVPGASK